MKHQRLALVIVALLSIGAGIAIAALRTDIAGDATAMATTEPPESTVPTTTVSVASETTASTTTTTTTTTSTTTAPTTSTTAPEVVPERSELIVGVANGSGISGSAARNVLRLEALGYADVVPLDGTEIIEFTEIYYAEGFELSALRLAEDLEVLPEFVFPLADAPVVENLPDDIQLLAYIGIDRAR